MEAGECHYPSFIPLPGRRREASVPSLAQNSCRRASVAVLLSPGWRLCLRLLFHPRQRGRPSADACHQLPSRLRFLVSPESSLTFGHMVFSPVLAQPGSTSLGSFHNLSPSLSIALASPLGTEVCRPLRVSPLLSDMPSHGTIEKGVHPGRYLRALTRDI